MLEVDCAISVLGKPRSQEVQAAERGYGSVAFPADASMAIIEAVWQRLQEPRSGSVW